MLIYIIHSKKIYDFHLPNEITGKYILTDYDKFGNKRNLINIEAKDNSWYIISNNNVKINHNNQNVDITKLNLYNFYSLTIAGNENILIYAMPSYDDTYVIKGLIENNNYIIGNSINSDITYQFGSNNDLFEINYNNGQYSFQTLNNQIPVYVNKERVKTGILNNFDTIFIMGLKIVLFNNRILVNTPGNNKVKFNETKFKGNEDKLITNDVDTSIRTYSDFYEDQDYYFKSPVFKQQIEPLKISIAEPPSRNEDSKESVLMTIIPMFVMGLASVITTYYTIIRFRKGEGNIEELVSSLIMAIGFAFTGIFWPIIERKYSNYITKTMNKRSYEKYNKYLLEKNNILVEEANKQKLILVTNNPSLKECERIIENKSPEFFSREIETDDFLNIRLGIGEIKLKCEIEYEKPEFIENDNELYKNIDEVIKNNTYIHDAPFILSLKEKNVISFICNDTNLYNNYMNGLILQLITLHSYNDLKIVVLTSSEETELNYLKDSNFCWNNDNTFRYYATNIEDGQKISISLEREFKQRLSTEEKKYSPYYLIISNSIEKYRNLNIINDIINSEKNVGFGILMYDTSINDIPNGCVDFVNIDNTMGTLFKTNMDNSKSLTFKPEFISEANVNVDKCSRIINNIPIKKVNSDTHNLPNSYDFLQMFSVGNVEQLNIINRWINSDPSNTLTTPIGIDENGNNINLDLHEKNHGPHGLIAGMTGSGKSELIITYILSLAINYRPDEVQFILIDYKGGGLAGAFENRKIGIKLPHLVGTITNLDKAEMKRTLVSINSELKRRQRLFNAAKETLNIGNIDIYKFQKMHRDGLIKEHLSHLFIICDEFAELKAQEPDFMDELVSTARIGRSLGIHLILATQKPSGVVDDQIWSNAKFKICCKVQTEDDSNEMIKKPDAAYLTQAGSFYLQVGYDEYFTMGQSAYSGFPYKPTDRIATKIDNDIAFISNIGEKYKIIIDRNEVDTKKEDLGEELINLIQYIIKTAEAQKFQYEQLWLDNIKNVIYYNNIVNKYNLKPLPFDINPVIGEYDDPKNQKQSYVRLPITFGGNVIIMGSSGSGKTTLLSTMIYSMVTSHNCSEVNIYIMDFGMEKLKKFASAPQVGDVITIADKEKIKYLFYMLAAEQSKRQKYYSNISNDFQKDVKNRNAPFPNIVVFIYDIDVFKEAYEDLYDEIFAQFTRNCTKYGIYFVITGLSTSSLNFLIENNFPQKIMLNMIDDSDYLLYFPNPPIPSKNPGRGLVQMDDVYEFQTAIVFNETDEAQKLEFTLKKLGEFLKDHVPPVPTVPETVEIKDLVKNCKDLSAIPLGVNIKTAQIGYFNFFKKTTLISTANYKKSNNFLSGLFYLLSLFTNNTIIILDAIKKLDIEAAERIKKYDANYKKVIDIIVTNIQKYNTSTDEKLFTIVILGYTKLQKHLVKLKQEDESVKTIDEMIELSTNSNFKFILFDSAVQFEESIENDIFNTIERDTGIWIGNGFENQDFIETTNEFSEEIKQSNNMLVLVKKGITQYIKTIK